MSKQKLKDVELQTEMWGNKNLKRRVMLCKEMAFLKSGGAVTSLKIMPVMLIDTIITILIVHFIHGHLTLTIVGM